jgi:hypothetical protein
LLDSPKFENECVSLNKEKYKRKHECPNTKACTKIDRHRQGTRHGEERQESREAAAKRAVDNFGETVGKHIFATLVEDFSGYLSCIHETLDS